VLITAAVTPVHAAPDGVRMLPSSASEIRFTIDVPAPRLEAVGGDTPLSRLRLDGYENLSPPGETGLPQRVVTVAVPSSGQVSIHATGGSRTVLDDVRLPLTPILPRGSNLTESEASAETEAHASPEERSLPAPGTEVRARLIAVGWMRNQRVARIAITPADYDRGARRLVLDRRIDIVVSVSATSEPATSGQPRAEDPDPFERVYQNTLVNYEQGQAWRRTAPARAARMHTAHVEQVTGAVPDTTVFAGRSWVKIVVDSTDSIASISASCGRCRCSKTASPSGSSSCGCSPGPAFRPAGKRLLRFMRLPRSLDRIRRDQRGYGVQRQPGVLLFLRARPQRVGQRLQLRSARHVVPGQPYERNNYFYLTISTPEAPVEGTPKRIQTASGAITGGGVTPTTFPARVHAEEDDEYFADFYPNPAPYRSGLFWEKWWWRQMTAGSAAVVSRRRRLRRASRRPCRCGSACASGDSTGTRSDRRASSTTISI
jgi:hypothetical protein